MKVETKVGLLFLLAIACTIGIAYLLGILNPFSNSYDLNLTYNFAGGIEIGSPVRVMGIKVGKVKEIIFDPTMRDEKGREVKLRVRISIDKKARETVRGDSRFYINLAGIIGEKFIEITPGSIQKPILEANATVRGEDPPRIDQLISQSYGLAGKIMDLVEENEGNISDTITMLNSLVNNFNKTLVLLDKTTKNVEISKLLQNISQISEDVAAVSNKLKGPEAEKTYNLLHRLLWRLDELDKTAVKKFLQDEGIKAKLF